MSYAGRSTRTAVRAPRQGLSTRSTGAAWASVTSPPGRSTSLPRNGIEPPYEWATRTIGPSTQQERDRWLLIQTAVRAGRVRELLRSDQVDIDTTESALGYRLRRHHLAAIAWVVGAVQGSDGLTRLDRLGARAARALNGRGGYLFVPRDESLAWIWIPLGVGTRVSDELLSPAFENGDAMVRVAVGAPGCGLNGFRQTHIQAERIRI